MPIKNTPLKSAKENRDNYNEWKTEWNNYKKSPEYSNLIDYEDNTGSTYSPISRIDDYINRDLNIMMAADSVYNARTKSVGHPVLAIPKMTDQGRQMFKEFKEIPTNDKQELMKVLGDALIDKEWGLAKENVGLWDMTKAFSKSPKILKYLPFAKRLLDTFKSFGTQAPPLYTTMSDFQNGYDPVSQWSEFLDKNK